MDPEVGFYFYSFLALLAFYILLRSAHELFKKYNNPYSWRWGVVILMAAYTFYQVGVETQTFSFMWQKTKDFWNNPPWQENVEPGPAENK